MKKEFISESNHLLKEWDFERNAKAGIFPDKTTIGSSKKHGGFVRKGININPPLQKEKIEAVHFAQTEK